MANDGLDDLMKAFDRVKKAPRDAVLKALTTSAESIASTQRALAPEDTGALKNSIAVTLPGQSTPPYSQPGGNRVAGDNEVIITVGDSDIRYPHLVEYGTAAADAQPFFWPGFRLQRKRAQQRIDRAGRKAIRQAWEGTTSE
ncbi:HK97 gp10 family phage protein [Agrobacterium tumefaciens]|uniref:HK97-gp10 family putative phage morphogenesis protein n=1 Tax=Agrobacterium tumefaciens TaxID=358 RepID=UPI001572ACF8|nr:HK97-gp10 family putative phage morphogenesis protein [Agrobacterium tumefaciens]NSZ02294.1 HK97 gp10 family phage protein [Agrobacterium tumefaciens]NSZ37853.1 HK97 gp10 family phage protein [Agrobacterium tumefaciens]NTB22056.1 HK97 gp10 family phage protein [Agrobacterium tumefaciens]NTB28901.1 HK97 gp10 family phage protein [Agrobacterium tumefaciens]NTB36548.1 HK97 gp10 family phage protein [Agrobacterium tumefaciens]